MERTEKPRSRKRKAFPVKAVAISGGMLVLVAGIAFGLYIKEAQIYKTVYFQNTVINGIDASGKTVEEVKTAIASGIEGYTLTLEERGGDKEQITKEEIGLHSVFDGKLEEILANQDPMKWWGHRKTNQEFQIETMIAYEEDLLQKKIDSLQCFSEDYVEVPVDAYLSDYVSGQGYQVIPEVQGNQLVKETVEKAIQEAVQNLKETLSFEELDAYVKPKITSADSDLTTQAENLNKLLSVTVTYQFGSNQEVLTPDMIQPWLSVNADNTVALDREQVAAYVKELATKYNTAYKKKNLKTSYGKTVTISSGFYGWRINQGAETEELYNIIRSGESQTREPVYSQKAASHGANDYGDTYVEINLTAQHLFFYKDGKLLVEADFVSGNTSKGYDTPGGAFPLTYKERNATLKGENYATPVSYWMPFNGNIGMHDADWRSSFGGNIYKTNGSHGCINLPPAKAKIIYENISQGMPVLCYFLEGTGGKETSSAPQETTPAASSAAVPETTKAPESTTAAPETTAPIVTAPAPPETSPQETTEAPKGPIGPGETGTPETTKKRLGPGE